MGIDSSWIIGYYDTLSDFPDKVQNDRPFAVDKSTGKMYFFDKESSQWEETGSGSGGSGQYAYVSPEMDLQVSLEGWTTKYAKVIFYKTSNGIWHMRFNLKGIMEGASRTGITLAVAGVDFSPYITTYSQGIVGWCSGAVMNYCTTGSTSLTWNYGSATTTTH